MKAGWIQETGETARVDTVWGSKGGNKESKGCIGEAREEIGKARLGIGETRWV